MKMHKNEVPTSAPLARQLIATQFPDYSDLPISSVSSSGTDNALYRLGDSLVVRLPRIADKERHIDKECLWLPVLAPHLPLAIPTPVAVGNPSRDYPFKWAIYKWIEGELASESQFGNKKADAEALANFITSLQKIDTTGAPQPKSDYDRGVALKRRDPATRKAIDVLGHMYDIEKLNQEWQRALKTSPWQKAPVWLHGDLDGRNMLVKDGKLCAVIDFGSLGVGDPAYDVMVAWKVFSGSARSYFRDILDIDENTWIRSQGLALSQAVMILSYYTEKSNPVLVNEAQNWMRELGF